MKYKLIFIYYIQQQRNRRLKYCCKTSIYIYRLLHDNVDLSTPDHGGTDPRVSINFIKMHAHYLYKITRIIK